MVVSSAHIKIALPLHTLALVQYWFRSSKKLHRRLCHFRLASASCELHCKPSWPRPRKKGYAVDVLVSPSCTTPAAMMRTASADSAAGCQAGGMPQSNGHSSWRHFELHCEATRARLWSRAAGNGQVLKSPLEVAPRSHPCTRHDLHEDRSAFGMRHD